MGKTYFIDSENVGDNWISLLGAVTEEDVILVFYTNRSPHMNYRNVILLKQSPVDVTFIECCEGNNALDFQLCTDLGYRIHELREDEEFIIVSNDTGFDAVVKYWKKRKMPVRRIQGKTCAQIAAGKLVPPVQTRHEAEAENHTEADNHVEAEVYAITEEHTETESQTTVANHAEAESQTPAEDHAEAEVQTAPEKGTLTENRTVEEKSGETVISTISEETSVTVKREEITKQTEESNFYDVDDNAKEILYLIGKSNLQQLHEALKQLYGDQRGKMIYNIFKSDATYNSFISSHAVMNLKEKQRLYCSIVFQVSAPAETMPEDFPKYIVEAWKKKKNLNSLKSMLQQKYGREKSDKYYALFKVHIKILDKLK